MIYLIVEFFCNLYYGFLNIIVSIFPQFPSFEQMNIDLSPMFSVIRLANTFINVSLLGICLTVVLFVYNIKFVWSIIMWLVRKIPGVS